MMAKVLDHAVRVDRPVFEQDQLNEAYNYSKPTTSLVHNLIENCKKCNPAKCIANTIPVVGWMPHYKWREDVVSDLISGVTVAIMHIPQGLAYAMLGNVPPIVGIYMAFFPVLVYFLLGTSRHVSMGTFAVVCLMTGKTVITYSSPPDDTDETAPYSPIEVATAVTFMVGIYQLIMWVCRAGIVCTLLSETLVSGFTTGAAVHVFTSQIKDLLGLNIFSYKGAFKLVYTYRDIVLKIASANPASLLISSVTVTVLLINNELFKPWLSKKTRFPIPIELVAIIVGTLVSTYAALETTYGIACVGEVPTGLPNPTVPTFSLLSKVAVDSFSITMVAYTISMSMALIFAQKLNYEVDSNQELLAQGSGNLVGSFFSCMPFTASLSRSLIQQTVGGKTQLASVFSCSLLLVVLLWVGPFFEPLPRCVLASIIVVALKGMFTQVKDLARFWRCSFLDGFIWMATFLTVVFVDIDVGLLTGVVSSLMSIFIQGMKPYICLMGVVPGTDLYLDVNRYDGAVEIENIKIFHYCGGLNFASRMHFRNEVYRLVQVKPSHMLRVRQKLEGKNIGQPILIQEKTQGGIANVTFIDDHDTPIASPSTPQPEEPVALRYLIVDFSALSYIDPSGVNALRLLGEEFSKIDVPLFIAGVSGPVYEMLKKCDLLDATPCPVKIFPTVHDAVIRAKQLFSPE